MAYFTYSDIEGVGRSFEIPSNFQTSDITAIIADITGMVNAWTKNYFEAISQTLVCDGTGTSSLYLFPYTTYPIISISSIKERDDLEDDWTASTVDTLTSTDYYIPADDSHRIDINEYWSTLRRMLVLPGQWTKGQANFQVIGSFGHSTVPTNIKKACVLLAREEITPGYLRGRMLQRERWADYEYETGTGLSKAYGKSIRVISGYPDVDLLLKPYIVRVPDLGIV